MMVLESSALSSHRTIDGDRSCYPAFQALDELLNNDAGKVSALAFASAKDHLDSNLVIMLMESLRLRETHNPSRARRSARTSARP